jgi:hypothetical protein
MRYIVKYRKPGQVEGNRLFDIPKDSEREAIVRAAEMVAGSGAEIVSVTPNDGSIPKEEATHGPNA